MMSFINEYGLFLAKALTFLVVFLLGLAGFMAMTRKPEMKIEIESLNEQYNTLKNEMNGVMKHIKPKKLSRQERKDQQHLPTLFVIDFVGDMKASAAESLRKMVSAILLVAQPTDEVVVRIESPGGMVSGYGLCASQLQRIRDRNIPLTACIDKVAASGGYLMACVANQIIAAPFAILGSIGVVAQLPNFHRLLKNNQIDVDVYTSGEYKRTVTMFGENTEKGRQKFKEELEQVHHAFKQYVLANRPQIDIEEVSTGEHWLATDAFERRLVDKISTSDDYLLSKLEAYQLFLVRVPEKISFMHKLMKPVMQLFHTPLY
jgi:serine protease SohB